MSGGGGSSSCKLKNIKDCLHACLCVVRFVKARELVFLTPQHKNTSFNLTNGVVIIKSPSPSPLIFIVYLSVLSGFGSLHGGSWMKIR